MRHYEFKDTHGDNLPTVRIQKAVLENFKSVNYGEITFDCGRHFVPYDTKSDILGIYGQNGSGKTSLIEALSILDAAMCGAKIPDIYSECIEKGKEKAHLEFTFDLQYPDGRIRKGKRRGTDQRQGVAVLKKLRIPLQLHGSGQRTGP